MDFIKWATLVLALLVIFGGVILWKLLATKEPAKGRVVAKRELQAFTLLHDGDLGVPAGITVSKENISDFTDRYLLVNLKQDAEVKGEMVASKGATPLLKNAVAVSVSAPWRRRSEANCASEI
jgi:hypothetical protein